MKDYFDEQIINDLEDLAREADAIGDYETANKALMKIERLSNQAVGKALGLNLDVPGAEQDAAAAAYYAEQAKKPKTTIGQNIIGAGEAGLSALTGGTTGFLGQAAGALQQAGREVAAGQYGTTEAANRIEQRAADVGASATYSPRTEAGRNILGALGEVAEPLAGLSPLTQELSVIGQSARMAAPAARSALANEAALVLPKGEARENQVQKSVNSAKKQGIDERFITALTELNREEKKKVYNMVDTIDRGEKEFYASKYQRPSDILGDSLADRVKYVKDVNKRAGKEVDAAVKTLPEFVDSSAALNNLSSGLNDMGVRMDKKGSPIFRRSEVQGFAPDEKVLTHVVNRAREAKTAKDLHNLKKYIYNNVHFGKRSEGGITPKTEITLKNLARDINTALGDASQDYRSANQVYSETIESLGDLQKAVGTIDITGEGADKALGSRLRALLSNQQRRVDLQNTVQDIDSVSQKYGAKFSDDILKQAAIVDELERIYGSQAKTSIGGELGKQAEQLVDKGATRLALEKGFSLLSKSEKQKRAESIKTLKKLLKSEF